MTLEQEIGTEIGRKGFVLSFKLTGAVVCGHEDVYDGNRHAACPTCGDASRALVRIYQADAKPFELFLLRELPPKEPSGPHVISALMAQATEGRHREGAK